MNPIPTAVLIAGFMLPPPTMVSQWNADIVPIRRLPIERSSAQTNLLVSPAVDVAQSQQMTAGSDVLPMFDKADFVQMGLTLFGSLLDGWDGSDSQAPAQENLDAAKAFLAKIPAGMPIPKAMLSASGEVGLYWDTPTMFADISFEGNGKLSLFTRQKFGQHLENFVDDVSLADVTQEWLSRNLGIALAA